LLPGAGLFLDAFWELSTDRQIGMGAGPIPAGAIERHTAGWPPCDADMFRTCIRAMDRVFLRHANGGEAEETDSDNPARDAFFAAMR
jgi:hypothetical protein